jgi:hypothetical protein
MPRYMLLIYNPVEGAATTDKKGWEGTATPEEMAEEHQRWISYTQELKQAGALMANHGLQGAEAATTVRVRDGETQITDGPFAETKELLAGFYLVEAEDLDKALEYAARMPNAVYGSVEVRPVWG